MSALITWEWGYLLASMMWGMALALCYDFIRIFRRIVAHSGTVWIFVEDIVFWMCCGFAVFHVTFLINDGIVRSFSIVGFILGAFIYRVATNDWLVEIITVLVNFILKPLKILIKYSKIIFGKIGCGFKKLHFKAKVTINEKVRDKTGKAGKTEKTKAF
ncbi:MAG: spore cortex biosynthesis protein YabQ [Bacteroides sp.]|nr:spore cortex biosynthesis protein YabQ [Clostridia bacterium]